jgi:hypothetical protein
MFSLTFADKNAVVAIPIKAHTRKIKGNLVAFRNADEAVKKNT